jgi:hypothetical protein
MEVTKWLKPSGSPRSALIGSVGVIAAAILIRHKWKKAGILPVLDLHRQDRTSFAWRTHSITSSARASGGTQGQAKLLPAVTKCQSELTSLSPKRAYCPLRHL